MKVRLVGAALLLALFQGNAIAANVTSEQLDNQQKSLNQINYRIDQILQSLSQYRLARDEHYLGQNGVSDKVSKWYAEHNVWMNKMNDLRRRLSDHQSLAKSDAGAFKSEMSLLLNELYIAIDESSHIRKQAIRGMAVLNDIPQYPTDYIQEFSATIPALNTNVTTTYGAFDDISKTFTAEQMSRLESALLLTSDVLASIISLSRLQYPELTQSLENLKQLFAVESLVSKPVDDASKAASFVTSRARRDWFLADAHFKAFEASYQKDRARIISSPLEASLKQPSLNFMDRKYNDAKRALSVAQRRAYITLYDVYRRTLSTYAPQCKISANHQKYNCALLKSLIGLDRTAIQKMTLDQQRYLHAQLSRVPQAPFSEVTQ
ncbi:hypothetical protein VINI7043_17199 [Vibrio nigripulchritudo ATCC 27043]|uniref:hypothetical protein n=1 Tax=Vibrio nigripulchritudo TaxID=28173 RepID=UPI00021C0E28|nr:hypothetical protein [Vibrio nigripulchritudo]EGU56610.1 hypothetical protein VINI7043_17199 [Vibrio nigripulchritudo ATCC 27043]